MLERCVTTALLIDAKLPTLQHSSIWQGGHSQAEGKIVPEEMDPENTGAYLNGFTTWSAPSVGRPGTSSE